MIGTSPISGLRMTRMFPPKLISEMLAPTLSSEIEISESADEVKRIPISKTISLSVGVE